MNKSAGAVLAVLLFFGLSIVGVFAQNASVVSDSDAIKYAGHSVAVEGTVARAFKSKNGNVFLDFGGTYPNETFVAWIPVDAPEAADSGLLSLQGKKVKVSGTIQLYRDKPEIKVMTKEQIIVE
jgi:hypothetical protein